MLRFFVNFIDIFFDYFNTFFVNIFDVNIIFDE